MHQPVPAPQDPAEQASSPCCNVPAADPVNPSASSDSGVGEGRHGHIALDCDLHERHEQWLREQYLRDLETLNRIEQQRGEQDACFFDAMGAIAAKRGGDGK
jgi:hypothetical protein